MQHPQNDLHRDALVLLRHLRFVLAVLLVALLAGVGTGLAAGKGYRAAALVEVEVAGALLPPAIDLARSPQVAQEAARSMGGDDDGELARRVSVQEQVDGIRVSASGDSRSAAVALANTWAEAVVQAINSASVDPVPVAVLQRQADAARQRWQEAEQALAMADGDSGTLEQNLEGTAAARADVQRQLFNVEQATTVVRQAIGDGTTSVAMLRAALAGLAVPDAASMELDSHQELLQALELRRQILSLSLSRLDQEVDSLERRLQEIDPLLVARDAARANYQEAMQLLQAAQIPTLVARVAAPAATATADGIGWLPRLGAAAAFGLVVGVVGAFGLEALPSIRRWLAARRGDKSR